MRKALMGLASVLCVGILAYGRNPDAARQFLKRLPKDRQIEQALNRLTFGPRPGDAGRVRAMGLKKWVELQLHPAQIPQNPILAAKLQEMDTLRMSSAELVRNFPTPQMVKQMVTGQMPFPSDPKRRMLIEKLLARFEERQGQEQPAGNANAPERQPLRDVLTAAQIRALRTGTPQARLAAFQALPPEKQDDVVAAMPPALRQALFAAAPPELRRKLELANGPQQVVARDLMEGKLLRAIYSD
ncbi:MAG TPA: DUF1800 family protein, partial [Candidatus Sulfopaludibacter sp.]|nr:DUF1800 family protein [Candidatus Sulfopaludibacter sp.]